MIGGPGAGRRRGGGRARRAAALAAAALGIGACALLAPPPEDAPEPRVLEREGPIALAVAGLPAAGASGVLSPLARAGIRAANAPCRLLVWSSEEGRVDAAHWHAADAWILELQDAGFRDLELCLELAAPRPDGGLLAPRSPVPPPERHAELAAWVARVVERYDADGQDDLAGLRAPVSRFRLGGDLGPGGVEPFDAFPALVVELRAAMRAASPAARLVLPALRARGDPPGALVGRIERLVAEAWPLDAWSVEASGSADELDAWLAWLGRRTPGVELAVVGGTARPLAEGGAPDRCEGGAADRALLDPRTPEAARCALASAFVDLLAGRPGALAWGRAEAARDLVQKAIVAASRGVRRAELASVHDSSWWTDPALHAGAGLAAWSGLLDPESGDAFPAYFALDQLSRLLRDRASVQPVDLGISQVRAFALPGAGAAAWVAWLEPGGFTGPGAPLPTRSVVIDVGLERVLLEQVITEPFLSEALVEDRDVAGGRLHLDLTPTPIFVSSDRRG